VTSCFLEPMRKAAEWCSAHLEGIFGPLEAGAGPLRSLRTQQVCFAGETKRKARDYAFSTEYQIRQALSLSPASCQVPYNG